MFESTCRLVFTHQDLAARNLILDDNGCLWAIDRELAGWYPEYIEYTCIASDTGAPNLPVPQGWKETVLSYLQSYEREYKMLETWKLRWVLDVSPSSWSWLDNNISQNLFTSYHYSVLCVSFHGNRRFWLYWGLRPPTRQHGERTSYELSRLREARELDPVVRVVNLPSPPSRGNNTTVSSQRRYQDNTNNFKTYCNGLQCSTVSEK